MNVLSCIIKSKATLQFVLQSVQADITANIDVPHSCALCGENLPTVGGYTSSRTSKTEIVSILWRYQDAPQFHDHVIKWKHFPRYWPFVRGIHRSPANSPNKGQWRGALMFSLICAWINGWVNNRKAGDLRHHCVHYDVTIMRFVEIFSYTS